MTDRGYWMGHHMLGDVIGFCAAAHLLHHKTGKIIKIHFQEERKDAVKYFDGIEWVKKEDIPDAIDCGGTPTLEELVSLNGVKRFYRYMDKTMSPGKSFDIHMNIKRNIDRDKLIGLITHGNSQGNIDNETLKEMIREARKLYPEHKIILIGNKDNWIPSEGIDEDRRYNGDISYLIKLMCSLDLLLSPQSGPCFIAAGLNIPTWIYKSIEPNWDFILNYDTYKVSRWFDRKYPKYLYVSWKYGLGDAILHLSCYYSYAKKYNEKVYWYGNDKGIEKKMLEVLDVYEKDQPDIKNILIHIPTDTIRINGIEVFGDFIPVPSDNCIVEHWVGNEDDKFIHKFTKVIKYRNQVCEYSKLDNKAEYLKYTSSITNDSKYITLQLCGVSAGQWDTNYYITEEEIKNIVEEKLNKGYHIKILGPFDRLCKELSLDSRITLEKGTTIKELFDIIANSELHIGVDSGPAHIALSCGVPYSAFQLIKSGGLGFGDKDCINRKSISAKTNYSPSINKNSFIYRKGPTDENIINSIINDNEYSIKKENIENKTIIDIGAHIGVFSKLCSIYNPKEILCFEPMKENYSLLQENLKDIPNIKIFTSAVGRSDDNRTEFLYYSTTNDNNYGGGHTIYDGGNVKVPVIALDDILKDYDYIDLMKIDCEGSEYPILLTTKNLYKIKKIIGEFHNFVQDDNRYSADILKGYSVQDYSIENLSKYLIGQGMKVEYKHNYPGLGFFKAEW